MNWVNRGVKIPDTLLERGERYGTFKENAGLAQELKQVLKYSGKFFSLLPNQREALEMIMSKVSRIICGDADYTDSWHDIAGYATLIEQELKEKDANTAKEEIAKNSRTNFKLYETDLESL